MTAVTQDTVSDSVWHVAAFYQFRAVADPAQLVERLKALTARWSQPPTDSSTPAKLEPALVGTILVAGEGVNGTIAGSTAALDEVFRALRDAGFDALIRRDTQAGKAPFHRMKVRLKKEIVSMGQPGLDLAQRGEYVDPAQWDELIADPSVTVIDTRNDYETCLGTFAGARAPETGSFRDFPEWVAANLDPAQQPRVAMFCTGGIRCEKATAYLKAQGFSEVFHLRGGILNYLEQTPREVSSWQGECFVFDDRVTVDHELAAGGHTQCFNCRMPLTAVQLNDPRYEEHVSCPYCHDRVDARRRESLLERARQLSLAAQRGERHLGAVMGETADQEGEERADRSLESDA